MKKVMKAAIAAGAAGALLLGGAGTMALWNDSKTVDAGTVTTGHLRLTTDAAEGVWADESADDANADFDPAIDHIVPGDTVTYAQTVKIAADGKNLKGALTVGSLDTAIPADLAGQVTVRVAAAPTDPKLTVTGNEVTFDEPGTYDVPVTITVVFDKGVLGAVPTPAAEMGADIDLTALNLTLNQVR